MSDSIFEQIYDMVYEEEFEQFNKLYTYMCRYTPCEKEDCSFAHSHESMKKPICVYHFSEGCYKSAYDCKHSHEDEDAYKAFKGYKLWMADKKIKQIAIERKQIKDDNDMIDTATATEIFNDDLEAEEIMHEMALDNEEEAILKIIEDDIRAEEVESMHEYDMEQSEENSSDEDECEYEDVNDEYYYDEYSYSIHNLYQIVAQQQMMIQSLFTTLNASQMAC